MCGRLGYVGSTACQSTTVMLKNVHLQVLQRIFFGLTYLTRLCFALLSAWHGAVLDYSSHSFSGDVEREREGGVGESRANSCTLKPRAREDKKHLLQSPTQPLTTNRQNSNAIVVALVFSSSVDRNWVCSRAEFHAFLSRRVWRGRLRNKRYQLLVSIFACLSHTNGAVVS